jgi:hypothetical protein
MHQAVVEGKHDGRGPVAQAQLVENMPHVRSYAALANGQ